jgi:kynurenine formamidase
MHSKLPILPLALLLGACAGAPVLDEERLVDLTHGFDQDTIYWPTARSFELTRSAWGPDEEGRWYAAAEFCAAEHGGTHLDAPQHFAAEGRSVADIPLADLIGPARVIQVERKCLADRDYLVSVEDIASHEASEGRIAPGSVVLIRTAWSRSWPDRRRYLGTDEPGDTANLHFPGLSAEAARMLADRRVALVGIDTASLDHGPSRDFAAHRVLAEAGIAGLENLTGLERLPTRGATVLALPMKIVGGTGAPTRVVALLP